MKKGGEKARISPVAVVTPASVCDENNELVFLHHLALKKNNKREKDPF